MLKYNVIYNLLVIYNNFGSLRWRARDIISTTSLFTSYFAFHVYFNHMSVYFSHMYISIGRIFSVSNWAFFNYNFAEKLIEISKASLAFLSSEVFSMLDFSQTHSHCYARCECVSLRVLALFLLPAIYHLPTYLYLFFVTVSKSRRVSLNIHEKLRSLRVFLSIESECFHVRKMSGVPNNEWSSYCVY